jgi:hypothetical protein
MGWGRPMCPLLEAKQKARGGRAWVGAVSTFGRRRFSRQEYYDNDIYGIYDINPSHYFEREMRLKQTFLSRLLARADSPGPMLVAIHPMDSAVNITPSCLRYLTLILIIHYSCN